DDVLEIVLDPRRQEPEEDAHGADGGDQAAFDVERKDERGDRLVDPDEGDGGERGRSPGHEQRQGNARRGVRDAGGPEVERDRPEPGRARRGASTDATTT